MQVCLIKLKFSEQKKNASLYTGTHCEEDLMKAQYQKKEQVEQNVNAIFKC